MTSSRNPLCAAALVAAAAVLFLLPGPALAAAKGPAAAKPAAGAGAPPQWGAPAGGYETMLSLETPAAVGGKLVFHLQLRGAAGQAVKLTPGKPLFGWIRIDQNLGDAKRSFYSSKVEVVPVEWPAEVAEGQAVQFKPVDLSNSEAYKSDSAKKLLTSYMSPQAQGQDLPPSAGKLAELLVAGRALANFTLCVPTALDLPQPVPSNMLAFTINPPDYATLAPEARKAFVADLLKQFDRSAFGGKQAHDAAVAIGGPIVPELAAAVAEKDRPGFSRMWLATTLADIRDDRAVDALVKLLDEEDGGLRPIVAYHGVKQGSTKLDKALLEKIRSSKDGGLAAWALLGYMVFRGQAPEEILKASLESDDPKARATAAEALAGRAGEESVGRLLKLLQDKDPRVRGTAAQVLGKMKSPTPRIIGALIQALDTPDTGPASASATRSWRSPAATAGTTPRPTRRRARRSSPTGRHGGARRVQSEKCKVQSEKRHRAPRAGCDVFHFSLFTLHS